MCLYRDKVNKMSLKDIFSMRHQKCFYSNQYDRRVNTKFRIEIIYCISIYFLRRTELYFPISLKCCIIQRNKHAMNQNSFIFHLKWAQPFHTKKRILSSQLNNFCQIFRSQKGKEIFPEREKKTTGIKTTTPQTQNSQYCVCRNMSKNK